MPGKNVDNMPTSYQEAAARLDGKTSRTIANNTRLERYGDGRIALILHATPIVVWADDDEQSVWLNSGGYRTVTTKARLNACLRGTRYDIYQKARVWYLHDRVLGIDIYFDDGEKWNLNRDLVPR